ncbi:MAG: hypothetical protein V4531_03770 [Actinomycetota bacterium]
MTIDASGAPTHGEPKHDERRDVPIAPHMIDHRRQLTADRPASAPLIGSLHHSAASMAIAPGANVKVIQRMLGRADASMTLNTYAGLWPDRLDEVTAAVSAQRAKALRRASES